MSLHTVCSLIHPPTPTPPSPTVRIGRRATHDSVGRTTHARTHTSCLRAARHGDLVPSKLRSPSRGGTVDRGGVAGLRRAGGKNGAQQVFGCTVSATPPSPPPLPSPPCIPSSAPGCRGQSHQGGDQQRVGIVPSTSSPSKKMPASLLDTLKGI